MAATDELRPTWIAALDVALDDLADHYRRYHGQWDEEVSDEKAEAWARYRLAVELHDPHPEYVGTTGDWNDLDGAEGAVDPGLEELAQLVPPELAHAGYHLVDVPDLYAELCNLAYRLTHGLPLEPDDPTSHTSTEARAAGMYVLERLGLA